MKRLIVFFTALTFLSSAQIFDPVKWDFSQKKISENEIELAFKATLDKGWYVYSQDAGEGPVSTEFTFESSDKFILSGNVSEQEPLEEFDPNYDVVLRYFKNEALFTQIIKINSVDDFVINGDVYFMTCDSTQCLPPEALEFSFNITGIDESLLTSNSTSSESSSAKSMWALFFIAFLSGFAALLTPCVFPLIPMTVAFFTKQSESKATGIKNAIIYGLSIIVIYVALGVGVSYFLGATVLNDLATSVYFNIGFFLLLMIFGISFLGAFDIKLPSSWANKSVQGESLGGLLGIFFMAFTLALVSFSCTGPIVGTLLVEASSGESYLGPIVGMLGFSLAIALPFAFFAAFPGWLNSLPKSGGWLNSVKVTLGFLEIALAFKFLSTADLVVKAHLLERELFLSIWIIIFALLTMYLLGFIKLPHDSDLKYISVTRLSFAILAGTLTIYMIPGLWGAPLKLVSGLPPPMHYSESPFGVGNSSGGSTVTVHQEKGQHLGPQEILAFHDYDEGLAYAKKVGKPVFIDFTGHGCQNCRKMEEYVWSDPNIKNILSNEVVLISLYVDEKITLPKEEQYEKMVGGKKLKIRTTGDRWKMLQIENYKSNSQPYYVLLDHMEQQMVEPANYLNYGKVSLFKDWLERGIDTFNKIGYKEV